MESGVKGQERKMYLYESEKDAICPRRQLTWKAAGYMMEIIQFPERCFP